MLYKVVLAFESVSQSKQSIEQYLPVVLFIMLYKEVATFQSEDELLNFDYSHES